MVCGVFYFMENSKMSVQMCMSCMLLLFCGKMNEWCLYGPVHWLWGSDQRQSCQALRVAGGAAPSLFWLGGSSMDWVFQLEVFSGSVLQKKQDFAHEIVCCHQPASVGWNHLSEGVKSKSWFEKCFKIKNQYNCFPNNLNQWWLSKSLKSVNHYP